MRRRRRRGDARRAATAAGRGNLVVPTQRPVVRQRPARVPALLHAPTGRSSSASGSPTGCASSRASTCPWSPPAAGRRGCAAAASCPAPAHLGRSLLTYRHLGIRDRLRLGPAALALRRVDVDAAETDQQTFSEWLTRHGQSPAARDVLWDLICRPTVNLPATEASLALAAMVFQTGLLTESAAADIGWASVPLGELHGDRWRPGAREGRRRGPDGSAGHHGRPDQPRQVSGSQSRSPTRSAPPTPWWSPSPTPRSPTWRRTSPALDDVGRAARRLADRQRARRLRPAGHRARVRRRRRTRRPVRVRPHRRRRARAGPVPGGVAVRRRRVHGPALRRRQGRGRRQPGRAVPAAHARPVVDALVSREPAATFRGVPGRLAPGRRRRPASPGCCWPGRGPTPDGRRRWRVRCAAATPPPAAVLAAGHHAATCRPSRAHEEEVGTHDRDAPSPMLRAVPADDAQPALLAAVERLNPTWPARRLPPRLVRRPTVRPATGAAARGSARRWRCSRPRPPARRGRGAARRRRRRAGPQLLAAPRRHHRRRPGTPPPAHGVGAVRGRTGHPRRRRPASRSAIRCCSSRAPRGPAAAPC